MQNIYYQVTDQILLTMKETYYGLTLVPKKYHPYMFLKIKVAIKESQYSIKNEVHFVDTLSRGTYFWETETHVDQQSARM